MTNMPMRIPSFDEYFNGLHGHDPYPWQMDLAARVEETGLWPDHVAIPTGLGKTACLDIAAWHLAKQRHAIRTGTLSAHSRTAPMRIFHVVDRRTIIDQTYESLATFRSGGNDAVDAVRAELGAAFTLPGQAAEDSVIPRVERRYGGLRDTERWSRSHAPAIVTLTAHQFCSRLLFRGFGVSRGSRPIHAGLTGVDRLVLFDEPHLSVPAVRTVLAQQELQTLTAVRGPDGAPRLWGVPLGQVVLLGATLPPGLQPSRERIELSERDWVFPPAQRRINALRRLEVHESADSDSAVRAALVKLAVGPTPVRRKSAHPVSGSPASEPTTDNVVVIVNTVDMAQSIYKELHKKYGDSVVLVTSRFRALDRQKLNTRVMEGRWSHVVATQTVEAGVDISCQRLVTELSPWPSLVQRVGRLNRTGEYPSEAQPDAVVHVVTGMRKPSKVIYDEHSLEATRALLQEFAAEGHGLSLAEQLTAAKSKADAIAQAWGPETPGATLQEFQLAVLAQTQPRSVTDLPLSPFIVGRRDHEPVPDVRVVWRMECIPDALDALRPMPLEILEVPINAIRSLVRRNQDARAKVADDFGDAESFDPQEMVTGVRLRAKADDYPEVPYVLRDDEWVPVRALSDITPGGLVVLPATYGGYTPTTGWDVLSAARVSDLSPAALYEGRWFPLTKRSWNAALATARPDLKSELSNLATDVLAICTDEAIEDPAGEIRAIAERSLLALWDAMWSAQATSERPSKLEVGGYLTEPAKNPDDEPRTIGVAVRLSGAAKEQQSARTMTIPQHGNHVAALTLRNATWVGLDDDHTVIVEHAAHRHDDGKASLPFQLALGAREPGDPCLAKSGRNETRSQWQHRKQRFGVPTDWRHEAYSAELVRQAGAGELLTHLVASHHGHGRPLFWPSTGDGYDAGEIGNSIGMGALRFERLNSKYGPWMLAYLESLVRLADWEASAHPKLDHEPPTSAFPVELEVSPEPTTANQVILTGLPFDSPLSWWAAYGAFIAATTLYPHAELHYERVQGRLTPIITGHLTISDIASELATTANLIHAAERLLPGLTKKNQKVDVQRVAQFLRQHKFGTPEAHLVAAVASDITASGGKTGLCTPFVASNSNGFESALKAVSSNRVQAVQQLESLLTTTLDRKQYTDGNIHGLSDQQANRSVVDGLGDSRRALVRALAMVPVAYGLQHVTNNGTDSLGTDGHSMFLPVPKEPICLAGLLAMMRTVPAGLDKSWKWTECGALATFTKAGLPGLPAYFRVFQHDGSHQYGEFASRQLDGEGE